MTDNVTHEDIDPAPLVDGHQKHRLQSWSITINPVYAAQVLDHQMFDRQRKVRRDHVTYLARLMRADEFMPSEIKFAETPDARRYLINGRHRLLAIVACGIPQDATVVVVHAADMNEVASLYAAEDRHLARSVADTMGAFRLDEELGISQNFVNRASGAMQMIETGFRPHPGSRRILDSKRKQMLFDWKKELHLWLGIVGFSSAKGHLNRISVISTGLVTLKFQEDRATTFWHDCAQDDGLRRGQPERALLEYLRSHPAIGGLPQKLAAARAVARAWNASYAGRSLSLIKPGPNNEPILFSGTPYNGKVWITDDVVELDAE